MTHERLDHLVRELEKAKSFMDLKDYWDEDSVMPTKFISWNNTCLFLLHYGIYIKNTMNVVIEAPEISPCPDGSLDLLWETDKSRLLINIGDKDNDTIDYCGDDYNDKNQIKNKIRVHEHDEKLMTWIAKRFIKESI